MIPFFPDEEKRDFMLVKVPKMAEEKKKTVLAELWSTFRELVAQVPMSALMESDLPDDVKKKIIHIEQKYLIEVQRIEKKLKKKFLAVEQKILENDERMAEELLVREFT